MEDKYIGVKLDGRYQVEELVGEGGMANVYRGTDLLENRTVAIKILRDEFAENKELVRRFHNESRAISVLNHPNIVKVFDVSAGDKVQYIVMEYIRGITLKEYIEQRGEPLTYKEVVHFMSQTLLAIQNAHDKGIIHRDIKPQNIMILEDGSIKVMDFGIARLARSEIHTATEQAIGSVHYISPEQAQGADTDHRADIYSAGIMMYEMLSGRLPFEDENAVSVAIKQISDEAPPLEIVNPSVPPGLVDITNKAIAKEPRNRYQDALEMLRDIEEFKRNPSIKFEYDYLGVETPARYMDKMMSDGGRSGGQGNGRKPKIKKVKRRKRKIGLLVPIVLGITIAVVGLSVKYAYDLLQNSSNPFFAEYDEIDLPDFSGMKYEELQDLVKKAPLNNLRIRPEQEYNIEKTAGTILRQSPESNNSEPKKVKANALVRVWVSRGIETVEIPNLTGMSRLEAMQVVMDLGLMPYTKPITDDSVPVGRVISTSPEPGIKVQNLPGQMVTIYVSSPARNYEVVVPDLINQPSVEDAQRVLDPYQLYIGRVIEIDSLDALPGTIIGQSPLPGQRVTIGTDITIQIVREYIPPPEEPDPDPGETDLVTVQDVRGRTLGEARGILQAAGFVVAVNGPDNDAALVTAQSHNGMAHPGTTITLSTATSGTSSGGTSSEASSATSQSENTGSSQTSSTESSGEGG